MTREEKLQKAHQMFDNRNLLTELKWQRQYFNRGYVSKQEELFNLWIFDECIKALEQEPIDYKALYENYLQKSSIVIEQLRADRDRLLEDIGNIRAEIESITPKAHIRTGTLSIDTELMIPLNKVLNVIDKYKGRK